MLSNSPIGSRGGKDYYIVDAFTSEPFAGNPAAVVLLTEDDPCTDDARWMQLVAREMNLSETAFLVPAGRSRYRLRWFTPLVEEDLCGHATLASARVLFDLYPEQDMLSFDTRSGQLLASRFDNRIELDFPNESVQLTTIPEPLLECFGASMTFCGKNRFDYLVEVSDAQIVRRFTPDYLQLGRVACRGIILTAISDDPRYDFISRFFAPGEGVPEDPVTGSAHCALGPYWSAKLGKSVVTGFQASVRGGVVVAETCGSRVLLRGSAVTVASGGLLP